MSTEELKAAIEAVLFTMGSAVEVSKLAKAYECEEEIVLSCVHDLINEYSNPGCGINIIEVDGAFQMCTKASQYENVIKVAHVPERHVMSDVLLETLSIVAYKQPVTKAEIELIRGVNSDHTVNKLVEYKLIHEVGRKNVPGRPILFGTTDDFLRSFGLNSLSELPEVKNEKLEDFKHEVAEEMQLSLEI